MIYRDPDFPGCSQCLGLHPSPRRIGQLEPRNFPLEEYGGFPGEGGLLGRQTGLELEEDLARRLEANMGLESVLHEGRDYERA